MARYHVCVNIRRPIRWHHVNTRILASSVTDSTPRTANAEYPAFRCALSCTEAHDVILLEQEKYHWCEWLALAQHPYVANISLTIRVVHYNGSDNK